MTTYIRMREKGKTWKDEGPSYRFDAARTVVEAHAMLAELYPDAPEVEAHLVIECDYKGCWNQLSVSERQLDSIDALKAIAFHPTHFFGGWYQGLYRGKLRDICQWHYEVDPASNRPLPVGTLAARRRAEQEKPLGGDQLDLFEV